MRFNVIYFFKMLEILLRSGRPVVDALHILAAQNEDRLIRQKAIALHKDLIQGYRLSFSFKQHFYLSSYLYTIIDIAEDSGQFHEALKLAYSHLEEKREIKKKMIQSLTYPTILLILVLVLLIVFFTVILPEFNIFFNQFDKPLPYLSRIIFGLEASVKCYFKMLFWGSIGCLFAVVIGTKNSPSFQMIYHKCLIKLPFIGPLYRCHTLSQCNQVLELMLQGGMRLTEALETLPQISSNMWIQSELTQLKNTIQQGQSFPDALKNCEFFPPDYKTMFLKCENHETFLALLVMSQETLKEKISHQLELVNHLLEPFVLVMMGLLIGGLLLALYGPLFNLASVI